MKDYNVYAKGSAGGRFTLECMMSGTRYACQKYIKMRVRNNQPTQFLEISTLGYDAAFRKFQP